VVTQLKTPQDSSLLWRESRGMCGMCVWNVYTCIEYLMVRVSHCLSLEGHEVCAVRAYVCVCVCVHAYGCVC